MRKSFFPAWISVAGAVAMAIVTLHVSGAQQIGASTQYSTMGSEKGMQDHGGRPWFMRVSQRTSRRLTWMGHRWRLTNGGMAGVIKGRPGNISVDSNGYLHLRIRKSGETYTGSEMFTTDKMGFGTYQWQFEGNNIYAMDPPVVLGLFPYGGAAGIGKDAENELDIEFSNWDGDYKNIPVNADFTVYPSTGHRKPGGKSEWEDDFYISARPRYTTARIEWSADQVVFTIMSGLVPIGETKNVLKTDTFKGDTVSIPQVAIPVGMNLWCFKEKPQHTWEVVVRKFEFVPQ